MMINGIVPLVLLVAAFTCTCMTNKRCSFLDKSWDRYQHKNEWKKYHSQQTNKAKPNEWASMYKLNEWISAKRWANKLQVSKGQSWVKETRSIHNRSNKKSANTMCLLRQGVRKILQVEDLLPISSLTTPNPNSNSNSELQNMYDVIVHVSCRFRS